jgi:hypothetical protein
MPDICDTVVSQMVAEHNKVQDAGALTATVILTHVFIDSMAWAALPPGQDRQTAVDFIGVGGPVHED